MSVRKENQILILILTITGLGGFFCMDIGHEWGDDFVLYLHQSHCWIYGGMDALAISNAQCMEQSQGVMGPDLYPQGFPLLMSLPMRGFSTWGFLGLKIANFGIFVLCALAGWRWMKNIFSGRLDLAGIAFMMIVWHPKFWEAADRLTSDLWFSGLILVFFYLLNEKWKNVFVRSISLGLILFMATVTRTNGIFLLPVWVLFEWQRHPCIFGKLLSDLTCGSSDTIGQNKSHPLAVDGNSRGSNPWLKMQALFPFLLAWVLGILGGGTALLMDLGHGQIYIDLLRGISMDGVWDNCITYFAMIGKYPIWHVANFLERDLNLGPFVYFLAAVFWFMVVWGACKNLRILFPYLVFFLLNLLLIVFWPNVQGMRLLFPILPVICVSFVFGLQGFWVWVSRFQQARQRWRLIPRWNLNRQIAIRVVPGLILIQGIATSFFYFQRDTNEAFSTSATELYRFIDSHIPANKRISFHKPRLLHWITGATAFRINNDSITKQSTHLVLRNLQKRKIDYWILSVKENSVGVSKALAVVFKNKEFVVYQIL